MDLPSRKARHFPATTRNRAAIADVLTSILPTSGTVLEIGSRSGEHALYFSGKSPDLVWQPSDPDPINVQSIQAWAKSAEHPNFCAPLSINASDVLMPISFANAVICINVIHISAWDATEGLMRNAANLLPPGGPLYLYGPYRIDGAHTAESNAMFDQSLRQQNSNWGVRNLETVIAEAERNEMAFVERVEMPANNQSVVFRRS